MTGRSVIAVARDPGAAAAIAPVVLALRARGVPASVQALSEPAVRAFGHGGVDARTDPPPGPGIMLSGTSTRPDLDGEMWADHRAQGGRVVVVLDHWTGLSARFSEGQPDLVLAIDPESCDELVASGLRVPCVPVGLPALDRRVARPVGGRGRAVLFVSEPLSRLPDPPRWDEVRAAALLVEAVAEAPMPVLVRPHPREAPDAVLARFERVTSGASLADGPVDDVLERSRVVVGVSSMLLVEAALTGIPVLSVRGTGAEGGLARQALRGLVTEVSTPGTCAALLQTPSRAIGEVAEWAAEHLCDGRAAERAADAVCSLL